MVTVTHYVVASAALFCIGLAGVMSRRNVLMILLCVELMLNAANLLFVAYSKAWGNLHGQMIVFFVITVAAAEVTVGLAIAILMMRQRNTLDADAVQSMKW